MTLLGNSWGAMLAARYADQRPNRVSRMVLHAPGFISSGHLRRGGQTYLQRLGETRSHRSDSLMRLWQRATTQDVRRYCIQHASLNAVVYEARRPMPGKYRGRDCVAPDSALLDQPRATSLTFRSLGTFDFAPRAQRFAAPVLVIVGTDDWVGMDNSRAWTAAYPNARLVEVDGAGHMVHADHPEAYTRAVLSFVQGR